jgi:CRP-like cAMP-binding protein
LAGISYLQEDGVRRRGLAVTATTVLALLVLSSVARAAAETGSGAISGYAGWAFALGALSAIALPLGSACGLLLRPGPRLSGAMAAFGAGALLAALSVELVAPTAMGLASRSELEDPLAALVIMLAAAVLGGLAFVTLDQIVNAGGGYLRKTATTITYFTQRRDLRLKRLLARLGRIEFLRALSGDALQELVEFIRPDEVPAGEAIFREGDDGDRLLFIEEGEIRLSRDDHGEFKTLGAGEVLGEIALLTGRPRVATAVASARTRVLELHKQDFDRVCAGRPELARAMSELASRRLDENRQLLEDRSREEIDWTRRASEALRQGAEIPSALEVRQHAARHSSAPLAIWLGMLLDGIPESFVIGVGFLGLLSLKLTLGGVPSLGDVVPYALIAGLVLSNFPEAMSSSVGMRNQGWASGHILGLWLSLVLVTGVGAAAGYVVGAEVSPITVAAIEGLAAGAMLTMIAQTMIPEAVHLGGARVSGLATLGGFVAAVAFKILET